MKNRGGFTLLEVLIALFIMAGAIMVIANSWSGNFMRIRKSALFYDAATLLERKMAETEAKYHDKPLGDIPEEDGGPFDDEHPQYRWELKSRDLKLPDLTPLMVNQDGGADESLISMVKQVSDYLSKAIKEVKVSVFIKRGKKEVEFSATEYFVDYTKDAGLGGGAPAAPGGGSGP